jgi:hypothetical protein
MRWILLGVVVATAFVTDPVPARAQKAPCGGGGSTVSANVVAVKKVAAGTELIFDRGSDDGITSGWGGVILDRNQQPMEGSRFCVRSIKARTSKTTVRLSMDAVKKSSFEVTLTSP